MDRAVDAGRRGGTGVIRRGRMLALALSLAAALGGPATAAGKPGSLAAAEAIGWRLGQHEGGHRLVLDLTGPVEFRTFQLSGPPRVVIDMTEIDGHRLAQQAAPRGGPVSGVRYGVTKPGTSRLVVDAAEPLRIRHAAMLAPRDGAPYRLVLDLEPEAGVPTPAPAPMVAAPPRAAAVATPVPVQPVPVQPVPVQPSGRPAAAPQSPTANQFAALPPPALPGLVQTAPESPPAASRGGSLLPSLTAPAYAAPLAPGRGGVEPATVVVPIAPAPPPLRRDEPKRDDARRVIVIDAGHGGVDPGAISVSGAYEKGITLAVAKEMERQLTMTGRYKVVLTRSDDTFIRLRDRVEIARKVQADLFISVHADSIANKSIGGMSVYTLSETASDREAEALATKENKADIIAGVDLRDESPQVSTILIDLAQRETKNLSAKLARSVIDEVGRDRRLLTQPHRFAGFAVLTAPDVPSILIELGYLSNKIDEHELLDPGHRQRLGRGIQRAVDRYFASKERLRRS